MYTPEGHSLEPADMAWWSLTCNIAREWRLIMADARSNSGASINPDAKPLCRNGSNVIHIRDAIRARQEKKLGIGVTGPDAEASNVVHISRGPRPR